MGREGGEKGQVCFNPNSHGQYPTEGKLLWGGPCQRIEIEEVDVRLTGGKESEKDPEEWEKEIRKVGIGGAYIFSDGSLLESGNVGGGAFIVGSRGEEAVGAGADGREHEVECRIGDVATV